MPSSTQIASWLLQINAIQLRPQQPFTWASGIKSPIYCDNRVILSYPEIRKGITAAFVKMAKQFPSFEVVAGVATAGIPHGTLLANELSLPFIYVRDKAKSHGQQNQIEGRLEYGQHVLVIEDLISTGGSSLKAVEAIRAAGGHVVGVLAIFSYGFEKAHQLFEKANCSFTTLTNYDTLLEVAIDSHYISETEQITLQNWKKSPEVWQPSF